MRSSRPVTAALRLRAVVPAVILSAAICLGAAACATVAVPGAGTSSATAKASAKSMVPKSTPGKDMLLVRKSAVGYVLTTSAGQTIYWYSKDKQGGGTSVCTGGCLTAWPAVTGAPVAGAGVQLAGQLGSIKRAGGVVQATYNGYPLYTYAEDMSPGEASGNGSGGVWHVISGSVLSSSPAAAAAASQRDVPSGGSAPASTAPSPSAPASTSGGGGGGYGY